MNTFGLICLEAANGGEVGDLAPEDAWENDERTRGCIAQERN